MPVHSPATCAWPSPTSSAGAPSPATSWACRRWTTCAVEFGYDGIRVEPGLPSYEITEGAFWGHHVTPRG